MKSRAVALIVTAVVLLGLAAVPAATGAQAPDDPSGEWRAWPTTCTRQPSSADLLEMSLEELLEVQTGTASKTLLPMAEAPGSITMITRQQIRDMNARTLREVLNAFVPGFDVVPAYFRWGDRVNEGIYGRGLLSDFSQQVLVLYNGKSKFNESTFSSPFPAIEWTLENIERIEVSRTPIPLYGAASVFVINLITRERCLEGVEAHVSAWGGSDSDFYNALAGRQTEVGLQGKKFTGLWGQTVGAWHLSGSGQYYTDAGRAHPRPARGAGGYSLDPDTLRDGIKGKGTFTFNARSIDDKIRLESWYSFGNADAFLSGQVPSQSVDLYQYAGQQFLTNLVLRPLPPLEISVGLLWSKFASFTDYLGLPYGGDESNTDLFIEGDYLLDLGAAGALVAGAKVEREGQYDARVYNWQFDADFDGTVADGNTGFEPSADDSLTFAPNDQRWVFGVFSEWNWVYKRLRVLGGLRLDHYRGFGYTGPDEKERNTETLLNPRVALAYRLLDDFYLKTTYASATRPPSIYERNGSNLPPLVGSPNTVSERVQTVEGTAYYAPKRVRLQLTTFVERFQDKIEYLTDGMAVGASAVAQNNGSTQVIGTDVETWLFVKDGIYFYLNGSYFWRNRDERNRHNTYFIPRLYVNSGVNARVGDFNMNLNGYLRGKRQLGADLPINAADAGGLHIRLSTSLTYHVTEALRSYITVENLTNRQDYVPLSVDGLYVPLRPLTVYVGLMYQLFGASGR